MSLPDPRRRSRPRRNPPESLPAPGPFPAARPPREAVVIFVVILVVMAWMLARGYSASTVTEIAAGAGVLACGIVSRLAGTQPTSD